MCLKHTYVYIYKNTHMCLKHKTLMKVNNQQISSLPLERRKYGREEGL